MGAQPVLDCHVHLVGMDVGGCYVSPRYERSVAVKFLQWRLGLLGQSPAELSQAYVQRLLDLLDGAEGLDGMVLLPMDGRYDDKGYLDREQTSFYIPNNYCFEVCAREPRFLPAASINPKRRDAMDELERVVEAGAVCLKTVPNSQAFDPGDASYRPFWRRMAELQLPWLTHTGHEHTIPVCDQRFGDPERLIPALEEGVTVVATHAGSAGLLAFPETFDRYLSMLDRYPQLYGDIAALGTLGRSQYFPRLLRNPEALRRMMYGSDYPVPSSPMLFAHRIGPAQAWKLGRQGSDLLTPLSLAKAIGVPEDVFGRAAEVFRLSAEQRLQLAGGEEP